MYIEPISSPQCDIKSCVNTVYYSAFTSDVTSERVTCIFNLDMMSLSSLNNMADKNDLI